ncbi:hypothetical protein PR202_ga07325 [Eleusine coracana subsp. coracana]|uniref:Uncharacterized protein n=1 Tax=Eleusine coracana subsp. coracana TaxID=191504 RepID=A0AAV5BYE0_ELECO|nr:hypothetical protein PR202_ga07325 [Eleusine coracana subsp. coracana]
MTLDTAILAAVVAFLLPLRLLSLALRLVASRRGSSARGLRRSFAALALTVALLAVIFALPRDHARECAAPAGVSDAGRDGVHYELRAEVEQLKLQLARLESLWDNSKVLDEKGDALEEKDGRVVRALGLDIQSLIDAQENIKESLCSTYDDSIKAMENEVRILKDGSKKMSSDIYNVQSLAMATIERVEALHSHVKKVQVVTDEWGKMNSNINRVWSFAKDTEKRVEGLYSDIKKVCLFWLSSVHVFCH